jgi:hypothetical protein
MHRFYLATLDGKRGVTYLNGAFHDGVFRAMREGRRSLDRTGLAMAVRADLACL